MEQVPKCKKLDKLTGDERCVFCGLSEVDELAFGAVYLYGNVITHYFCLLLSSNVRQNGEDEEGIYGFLISDIKQELTRGQKLRCVYCKKKGATIGCSISKCTRIFHLPCGLNNGSLHLFYGTFKSFCCLHRTPQKISKRILREIKGEKVTCPICSDDLDFDPNRMLWAPCCKKHAFFHRRCVQKMAMTFGGYAFKCPLCNDQKIFSDSMKKQGIFIPEQDAAWETEPNAFRELLQRHNRCDALKCMCSHGRTYNTKQNGWLIILCSLCGSQGIHKNCMKKKTGKWECDECTSILANKDSRSTSEDEVDVENEPKASGSSEILGYERSEELEVTRRRGKVGRRKRKLKSQRGRQVSTGGGVSLTVNRNPPESTVFATDGSWPYVETSQNKFSSSCDALEMEDERLTEGNIKLNATDSQGPNCIAESVTMSENKDGKPITETVDKACSPIREPLSPCSTISVGSLSERSVSPIIIVDSDDDANDELEVVACISQSSMLVTKDGSKIRIVQIGNDQALPEVQGDVQVKTVEYGIRMPSKQVPPPIDRPKGAIIKELYKPVNSEHNVQTQPSSDQASSVYRPNQSPAERVRFVPYRDEWFSYKPFSRFTPEKATVPTVIKHFDSNSFSDKTVNDNYCRNSPGAHQTADIRLNTDSSSFSVHCTITNRDFSVNKTDKNSSLTCRRTVSDNENVTQVGSVPSRLPTKDLSPSFTSRVLTSTPQPLDANKTESGLLSVVYENVAGLQHVTPRPKQYNEIYQLPVTSNQTQHKAKYDYQNQNPAKDGPVNHSTRAYDFRQRSKTIQSSYKRRNGHPGITISRLNSFGLKSLRVVLTPMIIRVRRNGKLEVVQKKFKNVGKNFEESIRLDNKSFKGNSMKIGKHLNNVRKVNNNGLIVNTTNKRQAKKEYDKVKNSKGPRDLKTNVPSDFLGESSEKSDALIGNLKRKTNHALSISKNKKVKHNDAENIVGFVKTWERLVKNKRTFHEENLEGTSLESINKHSGFGKIEKADHKRNKEWPLMVKDCHNCPKSNEAKIQVPKALKQSTLFDLYKIKQENFNFKSQSQDQEKLNVKRKYKRRKIKQSSPNLRDDSKAPDVSNEFVCQVCKSEIREGGKYKKICCIVYHNAKFGSPKNACEKRKPSIPSAPDEDVLCKLKIEQSETLHSRSNKIDLPRNYMTLPPSSSYNNYFTFEEIVSSVIFPCESLDFIKKLCNLQLTYFPVVRNTVEGSNFGEHSLKADLDVVKNLFSEGFSVTVKVNNELGMIMFMHFDELPHDAATNQWRASNKKIDSLVNHAFLGNDVFDANIYNVILKEKPLFKDMYSQFPSHSIFEQSNDEQSSIVRSCFYENDSLGKESETSKTAKDDINYMGIKKDYGDCIDYSFENICLSLKSEEQTSKTKSDTCKEAFYIFPLVMKFYQSEFSLITMQLKMKIFQGSPGIFKPKQYNFTVQTNGEKSVKIEEKTVEEENCNILSDKAKYIKQETTFPETSSTLYNKIKTELFTENKSPPRQSTALNEIQNRVSQSGPSKLCLPKREEGTSKLHSNNETSAIVNKSKSRSYVRPKLKKLIKIKNNPIKPCNYSSRPWTNGLNNFSFFDTNSPQDNNEYFGDYCKILHRITKSGINVKPSFAEKVINSFKTNQYK